jgi:hypothetical protein
MLTREWRGPDLVDRSRSAEENERENEELKGLLVAFVADPARTVLAFPPTLTNIQRFKVHKLVELEFPTLRHHSEGQDAARHVVVTKPEGGPGEAPPAAAISADAHTSDPDEDDHDLDAEEDAFAPVAAPAALAAAENDRAEEDEDDKGGAV